MCLYLHIINVTHKLHKNKSGNNFLIHGYIYWKFGDVTRIEPSDKINVTNSKNHKEINYEGYHERL